jgi:hypothetical protein
MDSEDQNEGQIKAYSKYVGQRRGKRILSYEEFCKKVDYKTLVSIDKNEGITKYWYLAVLLLAALIINENVVQWALAVKVGGYNIADGYSSAFRYFSVPGYLFFTAFRIIPYAILGMTLVALSKTKHSDYIPAVFIGGLAGIIIAIVSMSWDTMRPYYTDERVSSTTAINFLFIPFFAAFLGGIVSIIFAAGYAVGMRIISPVTRQGKYILIGTLTVVYSVVFVAYLLFDAASENKLAAKVALIMQMDDAELSSFLDNDPDRNNKYVLGAVASNKAASAITLARIAALDDASLHERYACRGRVDFCGGVTGGRTVMVQVAYHPNLSVDTFPRLAHSTSPYVLAGVAGNSNATNAVLEDIYQKRNQFGSRRHSIETALAANEVTPESILREMTYDSQVYGRTLKVLVGNVSLPNDLKKHAMGRIDKCEYEILDYPFTKCVPNSTNWESKSSATEKKKKNKASNCYYYYKNKQYKMAFDSCMDEASEGKAYAQFNLAHLYRTGKAGTQDKKKAVEYYQLAADQGYGEAQFSLGIMYFQGSGTEVDMEKARYWWEKSESNGISPTRVKKALRRIPKDK